ncbi:hypothetical protein KAR91_09830 [Candidatus Pacearchaeota archaeon]|nr:hypothetical protein [Candidatus Pacearchaeota archaeon]
MGKTFKQYKGRKYQDREAKNRKADRSCLNHGGCPYCLSNKIHKYKKRMIDDKEYEESI